MNDVFEQRQAFNFYRSYYETSLLLDKENRAEFLDSILHYQFTGELKNPTLPFALLAFSGQIHSLKKQVIGFQRGKETYPNGNPTKGKDKGSHKEVQEKEKEEVKEEYNTLFEIKDFNFALSNFSGNKQYFYLCYRYWELYRKEYPNHRHLQTAKFKDWYDAIRLMVESDKQSIDRIVAIYIFLTKCQNKEKGYETFLFSQVKSLTALRKKTASGEYRLDNLATLVNEKLQKDDDFNRSVKKAIETFKTKFQ